MTASETSGAAAARTPAGQPPRSAEVTTSTSSGPGLIPAAAPRLSPTSSASTTRAQSRRFLVRGLVRSFGRRAGGPPGPSGLIAISFPEMRVRSSAWNVAAGRSAGSST